MYSIYNQNIRTDLPLSSFGVERINSKVFDIEVQFVANLEGKFEVPFHIDDEYSYFFKEGVALYKVFDGKRIKIYPDNDSDLKLISETLLNFPLALCMSQKGYLVLHGSSVYKNGKTIIFSGKSHAGKSTTAFGLRSFGWEIISEDITVIDLERRKILKSNNYVKISDKAKNYFNDKSSYILKNDERDRKGILVRNSDHEEHEIQNVLFLRWGNQVKISEISNKEILQNLYKFSYISDSPKDAKKVFKFIKNTKFGELCLEKKFTIFSQIYSCLELL